jgi:hypothetical protein
MWYWSKAVNDAVPRRETTGDDDEADWLISPSPSILSPVSAYVWATSPVRKVARHLHTMRLSSRRSGAEVMARGEMWHG